MMTLTAAYMNAMRTIAKKIFAIAEWSKAKINIS
jgi:hypothetical protein